ncbi:MAG: hypothetical protein KF832_21215 [Caldilineaceae bacterium]|nr:hypothetical protein [Caldilineaceae bacterium]
MPGPLAAQTATPMNTPLPTPSAIAPTATPTAAQLAEAEVQAHLKRIFDAMSPADRVGQLFVITFQGNQVTADSDVAALVREERIGGIVLSPAQHNYTNAKGEDTPTSVARLVNQLQALAYGYWLPPNRALTSPLAAAVPISASLASTNAGSSPGIPLLIGIEQLGDGYPTTALRRNFTALPSQMALGATWNPALVQSVGQIVGQELSAVGINLLLGPNLDVVNEPRTDPVGALGLQSFGGDPYWVSQLGRAYIAGVHEGSGNRVATIARHFPGQGDIDRFPDQEVATVQKSLSELRRLALPPFASVTRLPSPILSLRGDAFSTDGLMTSHMRFSALQGGAAGRTTPISLLPDLKMVLNNEGLNDWYAAGGVVMTNGLGLPAVRRYYDATLLKFPYKRVVWDAFVAGHDLLYLAHLSPDGSWDTEKQYLQEILQFFRDRYESDPEFRVQVDNAVYRILRLKFGLYPPQGDNVPPLPFAEAPTNATILVPMARVLRQTADIALFAEASSHRADAASIISQVTRASITLLYPPVQNLSDAIATPPQADDQILIFSDSRLFYECEGCIAETALGPEDLKGIITRLYGSDPGGTGQINPERVYGRSFVELAAWLDSPAVAAGQSVTTTARITDVMPVRPATDGEIAPTSVTDELSDDGEALVEEILPPNARLQQLIDNSNWIIFAMLDVDPENKSGSDVVKRFLRQQSERLGNKQIIVLALNAPYFLDGTEISKLTAYFGVYSKTQPFLESAIRAIFRSSTPPGAPPVSVPGTRFSSLAEQLKPDPLVPLQLALEVGDTLLPLPIANTIPEPVINVGDNLRLTVSRILDQNGHPVPDGVAVDFHLTYDENDMVIPLAAVPVRNGTAVQSLLIEQPGRLLISASAGAATTGPTVALRVQGGTQLVATTNLTQTGEASTTAAVLTATQPTTLAQTSLMAANNELTVGSQSPEVNAVTLIIAFLTIIVTLSLLLILQVRILPRAMLVQNMLWATIFGLSLYILYGLGVLPGLGFLHQTLRVWWAAVVVFIGMLLPLLWLQLRAE